MQCSVTMLSMAAGARLYCCVASPLVEQLGSEQDEAEFTTDQLDEAYFGLNGDPDDSSSTADASAVVADDAEGEEALELSEAEHLFTVSEFLSTAEELRQHFDDRCQPVLK